MECNTVERARNRHKSRIKKKEWASSVGLCQKHKPQHPHHVKVSPRRLVIGRVKRHIKSKGQIIGSTFLTELCGSPFSFHAEYIRKLRACTRYVLCYGYIVTITSQFQGNVF